MGQFSLLWSEVLFRWFGPRGMWRFETIQKYYYNLNLRTLFAVFSGSLSSEDSGLAFLGAFLTFSFSSSSSTIGSTGNFLLLRPLGWPKKHFKFTVCLRSNVCSFLRKTLLAASFPLLIPANHLQLAFLFLFFHVIIFPKNNEIPVKIPNRALSFPPFLGDVCEVYYLARFHGCARSWLMWRYFALGKGLSLAPWIASSLLSTLL